MFHPHIRISRKKRQTCVSNFKRSMFHNLNQDESMLFSLTPMQMLESIDLELKRTFFANPRDCAQGIVHEDHQYAQLHADYMMMTPESSISDPIPASNYKFTPLPEQLEWNTFEAPQQTLQNQITYSGLENNELGCALGLHMHLLHPANASPNISSTVSEGSYDLNGWNGAGFGSRVESGYASWQAQMFENNNNLVSTNNDNKGFVSTDGDTSVINLNHEVRTNYSSFVGSNSGHGGREMITISDQLEEMAASGGGNAGSSGNAAVDSSSSYEGKSSKYRGVSKHKLSNRYEAHLWDSSCSKQNPQTGQRGRQVYLGGYDDEEKAARAYDLAAIKYWDLLTPTNFPITEYVPEICMMENMSKHEVVAWLRRNSSVNKKGSSIYRGVMYRSSYKRRRWVARIGRVWNYKDLYLGAFETEEEAAEAYDIASIKFRGPGAVTNLDTSRYDLNAIANNPLPVGRQEKNKHKRDGKEVVGSSSNINVNRDKASFDPAIFLYQQATERSRVDGTLRIT